MKPILWLITALTLPAALLSADESGDGFVSIFDGTLKNWDGDPVYWRVENQMLVGEVRPDTLLKRNTFIVFIQKLSGNFLIDNAGENAGRLGHFHMLRLFHF